MLWRRNHGVGRARADFYNPRIKKRVECLKRESGNGRGTHFRTHHGRPNVGLERELREPEDPSAAHQINVIARRNGIS